MSAKVLDFRPDDYAAKQLPHNIDAEIAVLGAVLYDNEAFHQIVGLSPEHFYQPIHGRIWAEVQAAVGKGRACDPILLHDKLQQFEAYKELGGLGYLADLVDHAPGTAQASAYAGVIREQAMRRELIRLADGMGKATRQGEVETIEIIGEVEATLLAMQSTSRPLELITAGAAASSVLDYLDAPPEAVYGVKTGLPTLDEQLGPMTPGQLVLLMGRPSMGKSAVAECIALNIAEAGFGVIQINGEMSPAEMAQRHLSDICQREFGSRGPKYSDIRKRNVGADQRRMLGKAQADMAPLPLMMIKRPGLKLSQLRSLVRRQMAVWARNNVPMGAVIIDHVGLLHPDVSSRDRYADQTIISNSLKELADELACPVIALNQMNRQNENREDKRPQLSDLRDSGSWEQDADVVIGFYREAYYASRQAEPKKELELAEWLRARSSKTVEAIVLKNRAGECKTVNLWGDVARNAIRSHAPEDGDLV